MPKGFQKGHKDFRTEKGKKKAIEFLRKLGKARMGKTLSLETRQKMSEAARKRPAGSDIEKLRKAGFVGVSGENHPRWAGDEVGYNGLHHWVKKVLGKAKEFPCQECGTRERKIEWSNISGEYVRRITDWRPLCKSCHRKLDFLNRKIVCPHCANEIFPNRVLTNAAKKHANLRPRNQQWTS